KKTVNYTPVSARESEAFQNLIPTKGLPMSDTMYQVLDRSNKQRFLEQAFDPQRAMWSQMATGQMQMTAAANSLGGAAEARFNSAFEMIRSTLINVANERATSYGGGGGGIPGVGVTVGVSSNGVSAKGSLTGGPGGPGGGGAGGHASIADAVAVVQRMYKEV